MSFADFDGANGGRKGGTTRYNTHDLESGPDYSSTAQRAQQPSNDRTSIRARELYNTIANNVKQLNKDMIAAKKSIDKLGTKKDNEEMRDKLNASIDSMKAEARETGQYLKQLQTLCQSDETLKMEYQKIRKDFETTLKNFTEMAKSSADRQRQTVMRVRNDTKQLKNAVKQSRASMDAESGPGWGAVDAEAQEREALLAQARKQELMQLEGEIQHNEHIIAEREEEIREIENTIREVNDIFRDLSVMVVQQGEGIDIIETNIASTVVKTEKAAEELQSAQKHQKSARGKLCWILIIILLVAVAISVALVIFTKVIHI